MLSVSIRARRELETLVQLRRDEAEVCEFGSKGRSVRCRPRAILQATLAEPILEEICDDRHDKTADRDAAFHHRCRALAGGGAARPQRRRRVLLRGADHGRLLPPELRRALGTARERLLPCGLCRCRARRLSRLQALPPQEAAANGQAAAVANACRLIETAEELPSLDQLAAAAGLSRFHFHRVFKSVTGLTPKAYAAAHRARRLVEELPRTGTVTEAIYGAGFNSSGRFYEASQDLLGMTPTRFPRRRRRHNHPLRRRPMLARRDPGRGDRERRLRHHAGRGSRRARARSREPLSQGEAIGGDESFEEWVAKVVGFVEAPHLGLDLPLDLRGTAFQQRVWQALRDIPPGATTTYTEIALRLGVPSAVRAVAQLAPRTRSRSPFPAIAWCGATARSPAIAGASSASARCSTAKRGHERRRPRRPRGAVRRGARCGARVAPSCGGARRAWRGAPAGAARTRGKRHARARL